MSVYVSVRPSVRSFVRFSVCIYNYLCVRACERAYLCASVRAGVHACIHASAWKLLRIKVTPDLHLTYSKNGGNLGLVLKMKNIACISIFFDKTCKIYFFIFV